MTSPFKVQHRCGQRFSLGRQSICQLIQAEAAAVLQVVNLASSERWTNVIFEGNSKDFFDSLFVEGFQPNWSISDIVSNVFNLQRVFPCVSFVWVRRACNFTTHVAAKFTLNTSVSCCFNKESLSAVLSDASRTDFPPVLLFFD